MKRCNKNTSNFLNAHKFPFMPAFVRKLFVPVTLLFAIVSPLEVASGQISRDSDILGFKLSMTQDQAKDYATHTYPNGNLTRFPVSLTIGGYAVETTAGFAVDCKTPTLNYLCDVTNVAFNPTPNSTEIYAISRATRFSDYSLRDQTQGIPGRGTPITEENLISSLIAKYGKPDISDSARHLYAWGTNKNMLRKLALNRNFWSESFLGEPTVAAPLSAGANITPDTFRNMAIHLGQTVDWLLGNGSPFDFLNRVGNPSELDKCGIILRVELYINYVNHTVGEMQEYLIDLGDGAIQVKQFAKSVAAGTAALKQKQMDDASKNKPSL